ncbi:protein transport protein bet1 [Irineochytrium annulatum]|nr:protein transport protein bet1 [Irineochytrium annulatum]
MDSLLVYPRTGEPRTPLLPLVLVDDVLLAILCLLDPAELAACATASRHLFLLSTPLLWQHGSVNDAMRYTSPGELADRDPLCNAALTPWSPEWRRTLYLRSVRAINISLRTPMETPAELMPWLGRLDVVRLQSDESLLISGDAALPPTLQQQWVDAVMGRLREGFGPSVIEVVGGFRWHDMRELLASQSVRVLKVVTVRDPEGVEVRPELELVPLLTHAVEELTASSRFVCRYRHTEKLRLLAINSCDDWDTSWFTTKWNFPALTHLEITCQVERMYMHALLGAARETLLTLKVNDGPFNETKKVAAPILSSRDFDAIAACSNLTTLVLRGTVNCFANLTLRPALTSLRQLKFLSAATQQSFPFVTPAPRAVGLTLYSMTSLTHLSISFERQQVLRLSCRNLKSVKLQNVHAVVNDYEQIKAEGWPALRELTLKHSKLSAQASGTKLVDISNDEGFKRVLSELGSRLRLDTEDGANCYRPGFALGYHLEDPVMDPSDFEDGGRRLSTATGIASTAAILPLTPPSTPPRGLAKTARVAEADKVDVEAGIPEAEPELDVDSGSDDMTGSMADFRLDFTKRLCPEVVYQIFSFLDARDVSYGGGVSRTFRAVCRDQGLWRELCRRRWWGKQFHPLQLHPIADWSAHLDSLSEEEMLHVLARRGVILRPGSPASASWPSSAFPAVSLWSWSWSPTVPDVHLHPASIVSAPTGSSPSPNPLGYDRAWLRRLMVATLPLHAPPALPRGCGKWMVSYAAAEADRHRCRITRMELVGIEWRFMHPVRCGTARFHADGTWTSDIYDQREWWRLRRDGRPQVNFFQPLEVSRTEDWGFKLSNEVSTYMSIAGPPPQCLGANQMTDLSAADDDQAASLLESQNDENINSLHSKIQAIKGISINLHDDVNDQNRHLDGLQNSFNAIQDGMRGSQRRIKLMLSTPQGKQTCAIGGITVLFFLAIYIMMSRHKG